ncbi:hypothetical protein MCEGE10_00951 [Flavobacteriaceae bacterium]
MKKSILTLIAVVAFGFSYAQEKEAKKLGFSEGSNFITGSFKFEDNEAGTNRPLNVAITYNKFFMESVTYGISLGVNSNQMKANDYTLGVSLRKYYAAANQFSIFSQIGSTLSIPAISGGGDDEFNLFVGPGFSYFVSENFVLETSLGLLNYQINKDVQSFTLNSDLTNVKLGVAYKF